MGHLRQIKQEYRALVKRLEAGTVAFPEPQDPGAWEGWREILEILYEPADAALAARLPVMPSDLAGVAARVGIPAEQLKPQLDRLCDRGLALDLVHPVTGATKYVLAPPVIGFFEFSLMRTHDHVPKRRMAEALDAYTRGDEAFVREVFGGETVIGRTLVHETALGEDPLPDMLDWERATAVVADARSWAVAHCYCRHKAGHLGKACAAPTENCLSLNGGADFVARRGFGRAIGKSEALDILCAARAGGLVQIADNVQNRPTYICNCCGCCCGQLLAINQFDLAAVKPSGFLAQSATAQCSGCSRCSRACPVTAITMTAQRTEGRPKNELRPAVDGERCLGCGICAEVCPRDAMRMHRRPERPFVPQNAVERSLRMVIERGHLAQFLFDEGAGRGMRFLNLVLRTLLRLPGAQRLVASRQVASRFVRAALARVEDPTGG
ncbi:MAG: 4Fe-4S dicluster domain-containing protein [Planctomycetes bacterium]|nr:4Fe-4S dicluster domain-containing protein [Planctomycetota bacterium]